MAFDNLVSKIMAAASLNTISLHRFLNVFDHHFKREKSNRLISQECPHFGRRGIHAFFSRFGAGFLAAFLKLQGEIQVFIACARKFVSLICRSIHGRQRSHTGRRQKLRRRVDVKDR